MNRTQRPSPDGQNDGRVVGVGCVFLGGPAAAFTPRLFRRGFGDRFEVTVINEVRADAIAAGDPGDRLATGTALDLQSVDARCSVGNGTTAAPPSLTPYRLSV